MVRVRPAISVVSVVTGISPPNVGGRVLLAAQSQAADDGAIASVVLAHQVRKKPPSLADELEQATTRVIVLGEGTQMLGQSLDALRQERYLDLRRACVCLRSGIFSHDPFLGFPRQGHPFLRYFLASNIRRSLTVR